MDAIVDAVVSATGPPGWKAHLGLVFERDEARSLLTGRRHEGPLRVQKALHPEGPGVCQAIVVHPPGGIVGGDILALEIKVGDGAHAQLTTPGATKWYGSAGADGALRTRLSVGERGVLEWLPQESLLYDGARAVIDTRIDLAAQACYIGWDVVGLGRVASGEHFASGRLHQTIELNRCGTLLWCERAALEGGSPALQSGAVLGGAHVFGTMVVAAGAVGDALLAACRAVACASGEGTVTRLPHALLARYLGASGIDARTYFASIWRVLRPALIGREALPPRIWNT
jgi:urease accessory protein